jgi:hypothetical protein
MNALRRLVVSSVVALVAVLLPVLSTPAQAAGGTTFVGAFWCGRDQQPMANVRIELWEIWSTSLPKVWPNAKLRHVVHANANGGWGFRVQGDETNWFVRAVFSSAEAEVGQWIWPWNDFADTASNQNDVPLHDYGVQVVQGDQCALWNAMRDASWEYQSLRGQRPPYGEVDVEWAAPTAGVPFSPYDDVWWPSGFSPLGRVPKHEFAHTVRHAHDGGLFHFLGDTAKFAYLQHHTPSNCNPTNPGFAFNEGWADYWAGQAAVQCPGRDYRIEATVARSLSSLAKACQLSRGDMLEVLVANPGRIHSFEEFRNRTGCRPRVEVPPRGASYTASPRQIAKAYRSTLAAGRKWLGALRGHRSVLVKEYDAAQAALSQPLPCVSRPCPEEYARLARPHLVRAQIAHLDAVRRTMAVLGRKKVVRKLVRKPERKFVSFTQAKRRAALANGRKAGLPHLDRAVAAVLAATASGVRDQVLDTLGSLRRGTESGDAGALQSLAWTPAPGLSFGGPSPSGITVVSTVSGAPVQASTTTLELCSSPPENVYGSWYPREGEENYPGPPALHGTVTPARPGTPVRVVYSHPTDTGERVIVGTTTTDAQGRYTHGITYEQWLGGYGRVWKVQAYFDGDADRWESTSKFCRFRAAYP